MASKLDRATPGSKLLARHEFDVAGLVFNTAHWAAGGASLSIVSNRLRISPTGTGGQNFVRYEGSGDVGERLVYVVARMIAGEAQVGPAAHITNLPFATRTGLFSGGTITRALGELHFIREAVNGVVSGPASQSVAAKLGNVPYTFLLYVNGTSVTARDVTGANVQTFTTVHESGRAGVFFLDAAPRTVEIDRYIEFPGRIITVTGLPAGALVQVLTSADTVLASATESGGAVQINAQLIASGALHTMKKLQVSLLGDVLATYDAGTGLVEAGETYVFSEAESPVFIAPDPDSVQGSSVSLQWGAFSFGTGNPVEYDLEYSPNGASWTPIASEISDTEFIWNMPAGFNGLQVSVRVLARDTVTAEESSYGVVTFKFEGVTDYAKIVIADTPLEYWKLEETSGDFLPSVATGFNATPNGQSFPGIQARGVASAICKGVQTVPTRDPRTQFFATQRAPMAPVFCENFSVEQWVITEQESAFTVPVGSNGLTGDDKFLITPLHGDQDHVDQSETGDGIGLGLQVGTNGVAVRQHGSSNLQLATKLEGEDILPAGGKHQIVMVVRRTGFRRTVELYINGVYGGDVPGAVYDEWFVDNRSVGSWPIYGQINLNVSLSGFYGFTFQGVVDEVSWYDYALTPEQVARHYAAGIVEVGAAGAFTNPTGNVAAGSPILVQWGAAVGADGYLLERWDGSEWKFLAETEDPEFLWTPEEAQANTQLRVIGTVGGFAPPCDPQYSASVVFSVTAPDDLAPPARRAWAFTLDGHIFYVLGSFGGMTLLYDLVTGQWCRWRTGNRLFWNMHRGVMWRGRVLAADRLLPIVWELDPSTMLDEETTEISRAVTGFQPHRGDVSIRQGSLRMIARQQTGAPVNAQITLRFSDDGGRTWSSDRTLDLANATERLEFRSLGRIRKPGRIWEIEDSGGLIRIDGVEANLEGSDD